MGVMIAHMCLFVCIPCQVVFHVASLAQDALSGGLSLEAAMHHHGLLLARHVFFDKELIG